MSFDLVVATVGRVEQLGRFLESVEAQTGPVVRVIVVDQNEDDRLTGVLSGRELEVVHLRSQRGLSRARNVALPQLRADLIAFPDDDCLYPLELLAEVARRFQDDARLEGLTGRAEDASGASAPSWKRDAAVLTPDNLWNRAISYTIFVRRTLVERVGLFDEALGLGSGERWSSGEEIDYLVRALHLGARIEYDPGLVVRHDVGRDDADRGLRDGASVGYLLRKHGYPARVVSRMLVRPAGGLAVALAHRDRASAAYQAATLRGRVRGYLGASEAKSSA